MRTKNRAVLPVDGLYDWRSFWRDPYHLLFFVPWWAFFLIILAIYLATNLLFAIAYSFDLQGIANAEQGSFLDAFFFSVHTYGTIGYGSMYPKSIYVNSIVTIESIVSLIEVALLTGLTFSRFARSNARIVFSKVATVANYNGVPTLMFRLANQRSNIILEAKINACLLIDEVSQEGHKLRRFYDLNLIRDKTPYFILSWLAMHPIDQNSPFYLLSQEALEERQAVIIVTVIGLDETVMQELHARHVYYMSDILWNHRFVDIFEQLPNGKTRINYRHFNMVEPVVPENNPVNTKIHK
ncbi:MAG: ion channel [Pseudanabaenaceae cyanobacterium]